MENMLLTGVGLMFIAGLLAASDTCSTGLVDRTFADNGKGYEQTVAMLPTAIANPMLMRSGRPGSRWCRRSGADDEAPTAITA
jgi:hypothetical protein